VSLYDVIVVNGIFFVGREGSVGHTRWGGEILSVCVPCRGGGLATVLREVETAVSLLTSQPKLSTRPNNKSGSQERQTKPETSLLKLFP